MNFNQLAGIDHVWVVPRVVLLGERQCIVSVLKHTSFVCTLKAYICYLLNCMQLCENKSLDIYI